MSSLDGSSRGCCGGNGGKAARSAPPCPAAPTGRLNRPAGDGTSRLAHSGHAIGVFPQMPPLRGGVRGPSYRLGGLAHRGDLPAVDAAGALLGVVRLGGRAARRAPVGAACSAKKARSKFAPGYSLDPNRAALRTTSARKSRRCAVPSSRGSAQPWRCRPGFRSAARRA